MRLKALLLAAVISAAAAVPVFAGTWTNTAPDGQMTGKKYYIDDYGAYARSRWVLVDGTWYWLQADGSLPSAYGISDDGYIFNDKGVYVLSVTGGAYDNGRRDSAGGQVRAVDAHSAAVSETEYNGHRRYRRSDYGPGAGGVSDPRDEWDEDRGPGGKDPHGGHVVRN